MKVRYPYYRNLPCETVGDNSERVRETVEVSGSVIPSGVDNADKQLYHEL